VLNYSSRANVRGVTSALRDEGTAPDRCQIRLKPSLSSIS
jgi:hypothetical protein